MSKSWPGVFWTVPGEIGFVPDFLSRIESGAADAFTFSGFGAGPGNGFLAWTHHGRWFGCQMLFFCQEVSPE
jgi:hypothetical protein